VKTELKKLVLVIDDDIDLLMLLERKLKSEGYRVETAASIPEAEDILIFFKPDLVLLDINVQGEDGRQLCWKLKKKEVFPPVKVIIMSGYDFNVNRAVLFGADYLLPKPLNTEFLLHQMRQLLYSDGMSKELVSIGGD
jgi:DNA-binding response OmpR family regulator